MGNLAGICLADFIIIFKAFSFVRMYLHYAVVPYKLLMVLNEDVLICFWKGMPAKK